MITFVSNYLLAHEKMITNRQKEIIEAAGKIMTSSGINGLTIKNLAAEMNFTEGAIYRHFKSKEEIILTMLEYLASELDERLNTVRKMESDPEQKFIGIFESQLEFFSQRPYFTVAVFSDGLLETSEQINAAILKIMTVKMKHLLPILFSGQQKGFFTTLLTAEEILNIVIGAFRLQMFRWRALRFQADIKVGGMKTIYSLLTIIKKA